MDLIRQLAGELAWIGCTHLAMPSILPTAGVGGLARHAGHNVWGKVSGKTALQEAGAWVGHLHGASH